MTSKLTLVPDAGLTPAPSSLDVSRFTEGDCHYLARAVQRITGWPICTFGGESDPDDPYRYELHAFVQAPDGLVGDVTGWSTIKEMCATWGQSPVSSVIVDASWDALRQEWSWWNGDHSPNFGHHTYARARVLARGLVDAYPGSTLTSAAPRLLGAAALSEAGLELAAA